MKYKVGDIVKLRDDLEVGKKYGGAKVGGSLALAIGKKGEIKGILTGQYHIKFSSKHGGYHFVSDEMIEGLWEECKSTEQVSKSEDSSVNSSVKKLKLIDILNKIANGELKEGTRIKYKVSEDSYIMLVFECNLLKYEKNKSVMNINFVEMLKECELIEPEHFADVGKMAEDTQIEETIGIDSSDMDCLGIHAKTIIKKLIAKQYEVINKVNAHSTVLLAQHKEIEEIKEQLDY